MIDRETEGRGRTRKRDILIERETIRERYNKEGMDGGRMKGLESGTGRYLWLSLEPDGNRSDGLLRFRDRLQMMTLTKRAKRSF